MAEVMNSDEEASDISQALGKQQTRGSFRLAMQTWQAPVVGLRAIQMNVLARRL